LLNQQPMGFYSAEVIISDARRHGVDLLPPDIQQSDWRYTLVQTAPGQWALRIGLCTVAGLGESGWQRLLAARQQEPFHDLTDFCRRTRLARDVVTNLIRAGALAEWGERRSLLWRLGEIHELPDLLPLTQPPTQIDLPALAPLEQKL